MIIYRDDNELITTTIGDINKNLKVSLLYMSSESFGGRENRFFKIISEDTIKRSIKHLTHYAMVKEARKRIKEATNVNVSIEHYDKEHNIGYRFFPGMKNPTIYTYKMIYPAITEFFQYWKNFNYTAVSKGSLLPQYDLSKLFGSMENFKDLESIFTKQQGESLKETLYQEFPEFAIFYYEIYPYLKLETVGCYDICKLISVRKQVQELGLDIKQLDIMVENLNIAENNGKVLTLIKHSN